MKNLFSTLIILFVTVTLFITDAHADTAAKMKIIVYDETKAKPCNDKSELWVRGIGSWWLKRSLKYGSDIKEAPVKVDKTDYMYVYPAGRGSGNEIKIPYKLSNELCRNVCDRDSLNITIDDTSVTVLGATKSRDRQT